MRFEYESSDGARIEREFSMAGRNAPPPPASIDVDGVRYDRVYQVPLVAGVKGGHGCKSGEPSMVPQHGKIMDLPASFTLPLDTRPGTIVRRGGHTVREQSDGSYTTLDGRRIIDSNKAAREACAKTGYTFDGSKPK